MAEKAEWTALVWIAGDNNLDDAGAGDIEEMKQVGSANGLEIAVQFDRIGDEQQTRRYHLRNGTSLEDDLVEELGETNTGDPQVAIDFFTWGIKQFPSEKVLAVIWNHGSGIDETDIYAIGRAAGIDVERHPQDTNGVVPRARARTIANSPLSRAVFATPTLQAALAERAIAYDDTSRDFLDNKELAQVLKTVADQAGRPIDVLGFDACLMNMVEVAYELRGLASVIVGSEETEPGDGWPYDEALRLLADAPDTSPAEVGQGFVKRYLDSYGDSEGITQSALDVSRADGVAEKVDALAGAVLGSLDGAEEKVAFNHAAKHAQRFYMEDFVDLGDFASILAGEHPRDEVKQAANDVNAALSGDDPFVLASGHKGPGMDRATGVAVYLPVVDKVEVAYDRLAFAQNTRWDDLIDAYKAL